MDKLIWVKVYHDQHLVTDFPPEYETNNIVIQITLNEGKMLKFKTYTGVDDTFFDLSAISNRIVFPDTELNLTTFNYVNPELNTNLINLAVGSSLTLLSYYVLYNRTSLFTPWPEVITPWPSLNPTILSLERHQILANYFITLSNTIEYTELSTTLKLVNQFWRDWGKNYIAEPDLIDNFQVMWMDKLSRLIISTPPPKVEEKVVERVIETTIREESSCPDKCDCYNVDHLDSIAKNTIYKMERIAEKTIESINKCKSQTLTEIDEAEEESLHQIQSITDYLDETVESCKDEIERFLALERERFSSWMRSKMETEFKKLHSRLARYLRLKTGQNK